MTTASSSIHKAATQSCQNPLAILDNNKAIFCSIYSHQNGPNQSLAFMGSCSWFSAFPSNWKQLYRACTLMQEDSLPGLRRMHSQVYFFPTYVLLPAWSYISVPPIQPSVAKLTALTSSNESHMHDRNTRTLPRRGSVFH